MKQLKTLGFVEGTLSIKAQGYGAQNGWGELVFDEEQIDIRPKEEANGSYAVIEISASELIALRDFLNEALSEKRGDISDLYGPNVGPPTEKPVKGVDDVEF